MKTFTGDEKFINNGSETKYSMLDFWRWTLSCIYESTTRGSFAEYIVKIALDHGGINANPSGKTGMEEYDLKGPILRCTGEPARIEVKSTSYFHLNQVLGIVPTQTQQFGIPKKKVLDENGDYPDDAPRQRNNDLYVFAVFNGMNEEENIFDLALWDFYVMPTYEINNDLMYKDRTNIRLKVVQERCKKLSFDELAAEIKDVCNKIEAIKA